MNKALHCVVDPLDAPDYEITFTDYQSLQTMEHNLLRIKGSLLSNKETIQRAKRFYRRLKCSALISKSEPFCFDDFNETHLQLLSEIRIHLNSVERLLLQLKGSAKLVSLGDLIADM